jgi:SAM-dependent methyltransferase
VDVRDSADPVLARARRWLDRVNARHPWDHNEHFHGWILGNLPGRRRAAVDVGCGTGVLAGKLAAHFARVTGIDADAGMAAAAGARLAQDPRVSIRQCRFEQFAAVAGDGGADLITMVAVLHHLDLDDALARIPGLLAPGGRLLVVGLARANSLPDLAADLISAAANPVMGLIRHPRPARPPGRGTRGRPAGHAGQGSRRHPGRDHCIGYSPPPGRYRPAALVLPLHPALGQAAGDRTAARLPQPGNHPMTSQHRRRPAPRRARAGAASQRRLRAADRLHQVAAQLVVAAALAGEMTGEVSTSAPRRTG